MLIVNADAPFWDEAYEAYVRKLCSDLDYRVLEGMSHLLMLEDPERFNAILGEFLGRIDFGG